MGSQERWRFRLGNTSYMKVILINHGLGTYTQNLYSDWYKHPLRRKISEGFRKYGGMNSRSTTPTENWRLSYKLGFPLNVRTGRKISEGFGKFGTMNRRSTISRENRRLTSWSSFCLQLHLRSHELFPLIYRDSRCRWLSVTFPGEKEIKKCRSNPNK